MGSVTVSAISGDVLPHISVAIKAMFFKFNMCSIYKICISFFFQIQNC